MTDQLAAVVHELQQMATLIEISQSTDVQSPRMDTNLTPVTLASKIRLELEDIVNRNMVLESSYIDMQHSAVGASSELERSIVEAKESAQREADRRVASRTNELEATCDRLRNELGAAVNQLEATRQGNLDAQGVIGDAKTQLAALQEENDRLQDALLETQEIASQHGTTSATLVTLTAEREAAQREADRAEQQLRETEIVLQDTTRERDQLRVENAQLLGTITADKARGARSRSRPRSRPRPRRAAKAKKPADGTLVLGAELRSRADRAELLLNNEREKTRMLVNRLEDTIADLQAARSTDSQLRQTVAKAHSAASAETRHRRRLEERVEEMGHVLTTVRGPSLVDVFSDGDLGYLRGLDIRKDDLMALG